MKPPRFAEGTNVVERPSPYRVRVLYREPTYERHRGHTPRTYRWTFQVFAQDETTAIEAAISEFRARESESSVGWVREIEAVTVV